MPRLFTLDHPIYQVLLFPPQVLRPRNISVWVVARFWLCRTVRFLTQITNHRHTVRMLCVALLRRVRQLQCRIVAWREGELDFVKDVLLVPFYVPDTPEEHCKNNKRPTPVSSQRQFNKAQSWNGADSPMPRPTIVVNAASSKGFPVLAPPVDAPPGPGPPPAPGKLNGTESAEVPSCTSCRGDGGVALASFIGEAN